MIDKREISPDFMARVAVLLFSKVRFQDVLESVGTGPLSKRRTTVDFDALTYEQIAGWMMEDAYFHQAYSETDCRNRAQCLIEYVYRAIRRMGRTAPPDRSKLHVFDLLLVLLDELLLINHKIVECSYEHLLSWRLLYREIGEELPVSIRHAGWDYDRGDHATHRQRFDWDYVTPHNSKPLHQILRRGIADHHSHLWGSSPYFHVSWVNLMNRLTDSRYIQYLQKIPPQEWTDPDYDFHYGESLQLRAAWIRWYLCQRLTQSCCEPMKNPFEVRECRIVCDRSTWYPLLLMRSELQAKIDTAKFQNQRLDYALNLFPWEVREDRSDYEVLLGERWLYYRVFAEYFKPEDSRCLSRDDFALFYAYFLIRTTIRRELVQVNNRMGFDNFQKHERRKFDFLGTRESNDYLARLAINQVLRNEHMKELEIRISPNPDTLVALDDTIHRDAKQMLNFGTGVPNRDPNLDKRYYYVFHFLRNAEKESQLPGLNPPHFLRMEKLRTHFLWQALEIIDFRTTYRNTPYAHKLKGIDAASAEIGCRPEVLSRVYRLLGDYAIGYKKHHTEGSTLPELGKTYHVGEDFLDVVDGLRAVDEAVKFLKLDCGDRIGHATVLGIDVEDWYATKHWQISLPIQDHLDNLAWMYHRLGHLNTTAMHETREWIQNQFEYWFRIVYRNSIDEDDVRDLMTKARDYYNTHNKEDHGLYQVHPCHYDIQSYYRSWTLRGDDPACYQHGYFRRPPSYADILPGMAFQDHDTFPRRYEDRYISEYSFLNYLYQYHPKVYKEGQRRICVDIPRHYVYAAKALQSDTRRYISNRGISIETNPTSNVLISTFRNYEEHPLLHFFNRGLPVTKEERAEVQLHVSINTDDSGVFCTNLETEYALMVRSVEMIEDDQGKRRFCTDDIHTWADNIRIMGLDQSFDFKKD